MSTPAPFDYKSYSRSDLLQRITHLETLLSSQPTPPSKNLLRPPKRPPKPFDPSRYHTRLVALKFAYLGSAYNGFEHHANNTTPLPTIEEELWKALKKTRLIFNENVGDWEGTEYSKCGRTDRGVSAFGQVVGIRVRSARPKESRREWEEDGEEEEEGKVEEKREWDPIRDELPYIQILNRVLPADIRVLAWCPAEEGFSARFNCKERRYRYFFTNPATVGEGGLLDVEKMKQAARKYEGLHDFRNLCKIDPSKQITNWQRRIFHADIHEVSAEERGTTSSIARPRLYYFEVRGSAFLWHQVRHLVAILFLVGQGYEEPSIVDELVDVDRTPNRPLYDMASDTPLVLWDCIFPEADKVVSTDHGITPSGQTFTGYTDSLPWIYIGDENGGRDSTKQVLPGVDDGRWGRNGIMDELWALWRKRKMDEVLAASLMELVAGIGGGHPSPVSTLPRAVGGESDRVFDGRERSKTVGTYVPLMKRARMESPDDINARYAARKGLNVGDTVAPADDADE